MKSKKTVSDSGADEVKTIKTTPEAAAKPRSSKKATDKAPVAAKKAAKKTTVSSKAVAEEAASAEKKPRAKKAAKGRDLVADVPAVEEIAEVLHEEPEEVLAHLEQDAPEYDPDHHIDQLEEESDSAAMVGATGADSSDEEEDDDAEELEDEEDEDEEDEEDEEEASKEHQPEDRSAFQERLQKVLAKAGVASRRAAEEMILAGRVQVNGKIVTELGTKAELGRDHIRVDGKLLQGAERIRYFVLNKPKGYVTTVSDPENRPTVMQFFAGERERLYPVGRLDYLSEGLLLVTNDGELANSLTKAANGVEKTYLVKVAGHPTEEQLDQIRGGMVIERGRIGSGTGRVRTAPAEVRKVREGDNPWFEVILIEGRNREIRKLFEEIGFHVEKIRRVGYGPLVLDLEPGKLRELDEDEINKLRLTAAGKLKTRRRRGPAPAQLERKAGRVVRHEKFGKDVGYGKTPPPRKQVAAPAAEDREERPARFDRSVGSDRPGRPQQFGRPQQAGRPQQFDRPARAGNTERPARFADRPAPRSTPREASTGEATGRRDFKASRPAFGDRPQGRKPDFAARKPDFTPRPPREEARPERPARAEGGFEKKPFEPAGDSGKGNFGKPGFDKPGFSRPGFGKPGFSKPGFGKSDRPGKPAGRGFDRDRGPGRGREDRKPFPPREDRDLPPEEFGAEPIQRTPGFRVEEVQEAPRAPRPPRAEFFGSGSTGRPAGRPSGRPAGKPFRSEGGPSAGRPAGRPAGKPYGASRPAGPGKPFGDRPARPFRERDDERGSGPRGAGPRPSGPRTVGPRTDRPRTEDRGEFRPRRNFGDGEERPRSPRPGPSRPSGVRPAGPGRPRTGDRPTGSSRPKPFGATGPAGPGSRPKKEDGSEPRVKNRWRNSFEGKNKGRPKPKKKD